jgi:hypothetical protein
MRRTLQSGLAAAVLVVDPKDERAARFYYRYDFLYIGSGRTPLYLPVRALIWLYHNLAIDREETWNGSSTARGQPHAHPKAQIQAAIESQILRVHAP